MSAVIKEGVGGTLTSLIKQLWEADKPVYPLEKTILIEEHDKTTLCLSPQMLHPIFLGLTQKRAYSKQRLERQQGLSLSFVKLLSRLTMTSLQAFKNSILCLPYLVQTPSGDKAVPRHILRHIYALILVSHPTWKVEAVPCKISIGAREMFSLPEAAVEELLPAIRKFIELNNIQKSRINYFGDLSTRRPPKSAPSQTIDQGKIKQLVAKTLQAQPQPASEGFEGSEEESTEKGLRETLPLETSSPSAFRTEEISEEGRSSPRSEEGSEEMSEPLLFLLDSILKNKGKEQLVEAECPKVSNHIYGSSCSLCILATQILNQQHEPFIKQLEAIMEYTTKEKLVQSLINLFSTKSLKNLSSKEKFSNFEIACIIKSCDIGDEICCPGKLNPGSQVDLYCALNEAISCGLHSPLAQSIMEIWDSSVPLTYTKRQDLLYVPIIKADGSVYKCTHELLENKLRPTAQRMFSKTTEGMRRRRYLECMPSAYLRFVTYLSLFTAKALKDSPSGTPFLEKSPQGPVLRENALEHIYSLILLANPIRKVVALPSKVSPEKIEEFSLSEEETAIAHSHLLKFARTNRFFLAGNSPFSLAKNLPIESEEG